MLRLAVALALALIICEDVKASYLNEQLYAPAVRSLASSALKSKCERYLDGSEKSCYYLVQAAIEILDVDLQYDSNGRPAILIFKNESEKLLHDPKLPRFLMHMRQQEYVSRVSGNRDFAFFQAAQDFFGDEATAVHWVGLLFQDNNFNHHRNWLVQYSGLSKELLQNYFAVYDFIHVRNLTAERKPSVYPASIQLELRKLFGQKIYYYFLNRILLAELRKHPALKSSKLDQKEVNKLVQRFPLFLNLVYSYHHLYHSSIDALLKPLVPVAEIKNGQVLSLGVVESHDLKFEQWINRYVDLYMAYVASLSETPQISLLKFRESLMTDPKYFLAN